MMVQYEQEYVRRRMARAVEQLTDLSDRIGDQYMWEPATTSAEEATYHVKVIAGVKEELEGVYGLSANMIATINDDLRAADMLIKNVTPLYQ